MYLAAKLKNRSPLESPLDDRAAHLRDGAAIPESAASPLFPPAEMPPEKICLELLDGLNRQLSDLTASAEDQFLAIGAWLREYHGRAGEAGKVASAVLDLMLGEEADNTISRLQLLVERMSEHLEKAELHAARNGLALQTVYDFLDRLQQPLAGFGKIAKTLQILSLSTKVESSHDGLENASFNLLATDVKQLARVIAGKSVQIVKRIESLLQLTREARLQVTFLQNRQFGQVQKITEHARAALSTLLTEHRRSMDRAGYFSNRSQEISHSISEVVSSVQFQDITRQQIDHVKMAFSDLCAEMWQSSNRLSSEGEGRSLPGEAARICRLQSAQLEHARDALVQAVETIIESFKQLADNITAMGEETREVAGATTRGGASFFAEMEPVISAVTASLTENTVANRKSAMAIASVVEAVVDMSGLVDEIDQIGAEMKVIALNAGIKAAHSGTRGASLGVIADAIQRMSGEALNLTQVLGKGFREIIAAAEGLGGSEQMGEEAEAQVEELTEEANSLLSRLQQRNGEVISLLYRMDREAGRLAGEISRAAASITVHLEASKVIDQVLARLERIVQRVRDEHGSQDEGEGALRELRRRYTMRSERDVHHASLPPGQILTDETCGRTDTPDEAPKKGNEFGDNVELF